MSNEIRFLLYDTFNKTQRIDSDFDKQIRGMLRGKKEEL